MCTCRCNRPYMYYHWSAVCLHVSGAWYSCCTWYNLQCIYTCICTCMSCLLVCLWASRPTLICIPHTGHTYSVAMVLAYQASHSSNARRTTLVTLAQSCKGSTGSWTETYQCVAATCQATQRNVIQTDVALRSRTMPVQRSKN